MKKITAALCTFALLFSLSSCGIERPDLEIKASEEAAGSAAGKDLKKFDIKDSAIKTDLSDKFHIDARISGTDISKLASCELAPINLKEDRIAELLMTDKNYTREEKTTGAIEYKNNKEKLSVQISDMTSMALVSSPTVDYYLDKGKEYAAAAKYIWTDSYDKDEDMQKAADLVEGMLNKLNIKCDELMVSRIPFDVLNDYYQYSIDDQKEWLDKADSNDSDEPQYHDEILYSQGLYEVLDENFKFMEGDDCFIVRGNTSFNNCPVYENEFLSTSVLAAVSSRGIEYFHADNLYSYDNTFGEVSIVPVEQAVDAVYKAYEESPVKDDLDITIFSIQLGYLKQYSEEGRFQSKHFLTPVWVISCSGSKGEKSIDALNCMVYASDGNLATRKDMLFLSYE